MGLTVLVWRDSTQALGDEFMPALGSMPLAGCRLGKAPPPVATEAEVEAASPGAGFMARAKVRACARAPCVAAQGTTHPGKTRIRLRMRAPNLC